MQPTNILFINSDQHSPRVLGCAGNPVAKTPNLDGLAARGTRFPNAYCPTPICVPSRASLATGRYAHTLDSWDNGTPYIGTEAPSWGHRLTEQGHKVTTIGKLHYRKVDDPSGFPDQRLPMHVLDGVGDIYGCLRQDMPVRPHSRTQVLEARAGESEYTRYDRAITDATVKWLREEAQDQSKPWALFCSFIHPHFPLVVPDQYFNLYDPDALPLPVDWTADRWSQHPVHVWQREKQALDQPFDEQTLRNAIRAYYGMVSFLDEQIGIVLEALRKAGLDDTTRIIYTTDHGEQLGEHGMWWKSSMYEGAVGVPMIVAGPDVPAGQVSNTIVNLVDGFPSIVEATGVELRPEDADLPGASLFELARSEDRGRVAFSEYHAILSPCAMFMLRKGRYKLVYYTAGYAQQLFDLAADPYETQDLTGAPDHADALADCERELRAICDLEEQDRRARADQQRRVQAHGGPEAVLAAGVKIPYTPAPDQFEPAPVEARERARTHAPGH
ncbi:MAG: sulfatase-like hydrolase/transferase [Chloroflexota bacterium]|nr:sulfatase-like hydrolase/transferase [Chloroflexota bacterium]